MIDKKPNDPRPTLLGELGSILRMIFALVGGMTVLVGGAIFLSRMFGPVVALITFYSIVLAGMIAIFAWLSYRSKVAAWEQRQKLESEMEKLRNNEQRGV